MYPTVFQEGGSELNQMLYDQQARSEGRVPLPPLGAVEGPDNAFPGAKAMPRLMKILVPCSTLDFSYRLGCTPSWWQLLKAFHEMGHEIIATPYLGDPIDSLWWRTYPNPCRTESILYNRYLDGKKKRGKLSGRKESSTSLLNRFAEHYVQPRWEAHTRAILDKERDIDAVLFMNVPINHIKGIASTIREEYGIPVAYLEGDMPTILPQYAADRGFKFNYYSEADLSEFDFFFTNSRGVIPDLKRMGARSVYPIYYAVDPALFMPLEVPKDVDVSYFGYGSEYREEWMTKMISTPSRRMPRSSFSVGGRGFRVDLGSARMRGDLSYSAFRRFCCASRICLNITRKTHTAVAGSSTARPFELAGFGACMVSQPYNGIDEWFEIGREIEVVADTEDAIETYEWLLDDPEERLIRGERARERVCRDHTFHQRADAIYQQLSKGAAGG